MDTAHPAPLISYHRISTGLVLASLALVLLGAASAGGAGAAFWLSYALLIPSTAAAAAAKGRSAAWGALGLLHIVGHVGVWVLLRKRCWRCDEEEDRLATECAMCGVSL